MAEPLSPNDEWRIRQQASKEHFNTTNTTYLTLRERMYNQDLSAVDCAKLYGDETIALTACPDTENELWSFVSLLSGSLVELATQIHYSEDDVRARLIDFINELEKVVVTDPTSPTGEQLIYPDGPTDGEKLWTDMPLLGMHSAEERVSFEPRDPTNTPWEMSRWKNLSAFWAQRARQSGLDYDVVPGTIACRDAFGPPLPWQGEGNQAFLVQVACIWIIHAAEQVRAHVLDNPNSSGHGDWMRWKNGLQDTRDMDEETEELVDRALANMERAEREMPTPE